MNRVKCGISILILIAIGGMGASAQTRRRRPSMNSDQQAQLLIRRIESHTGIFRDSLTASFDQSDLDQASEDDVNQSVNALQDATTRLRDDLNAHVSINSDVQNVLDRAARVGDFIQRHPMGGAVQGDWANLQRDLNDLRTRYPLSSSGNNSNYPNQNGYPNGNVNRDGDQGSYRYGNSSLTGTYRLDASRSDDPRVAADRATQGLSDNDRQRVLDALTQRLTSPDSIALDVRGRSVTIASTRAPQITFEADGVERTETTPSGRQARMRAMMANNQLVVSSVGDRDRDFTVTIDSQNNGRRIRMTRQVSDASIGNPVQVQSYYDRTSDTAQFNVYNGSQGYPSSGTSANGTFTVADGTQIVAVLNEDLTTSQVSDGSRFTLNVQSPDQYNGAVIDGHVSGVQRSGRITGRSQMTLNFDDIRLRNGGNYQFAGTLVGVRTPNGESIGVNNEGNVNSSNRTKTTEERAAIGTAVGAIFGAIIGGGKGAGIGAVLGAGTGAGSVYAQGSTDLKLVSGSQITIQASAPQRR